MPCNILDCNPESSIRGSKVPIHCTGTLEEIGLSIKQESDVKKEGDLTFVTEND